MKKTLLILFVVFLFLEAATQDFIPIWSEGKKPNNNGLKVSDSLYNDRIWKVGAPGIYSFIVPKSENKGTAVLICPGGGYERLSHLYNGFNFAKWFNSIGVNAFVLIYRLPHQKDLQQRQLAPLQDAQKAMKIIRVNAEKWNIKADKIGVMGVSAGGHVASMLGTYSQDVSIVKDAPDTFSYRPDFMILLSPVISMGRYAHPGSKKYFIGPDSTSEMIQKYSNELQITSYTPSTFIVHAMNDSTVKVQNSLLFYNALADKKINASIHVFPQGGHGIRLDDNPGSTDLWMNLLEAWLKEMKFIEPIPFK